MMVTNKMVIRLKDKSIMKGRSFDFSGSKASFHLRLLTGSVVKIDMEQLKAVFIVKSFDGDRNYQYVYKDFLPWEGNKVRVTFIDGEEITGYTHQINHDQQFFFLTPADLKGNNKRMFVNLSATTDICYL